jgi:hypothetical protein
MMSTDWKSNQSKLFLGGCGTQIGLVIAFVVLAGVFVFCAFCGLSSVLSLAAAQEFARLSTGVDAEAVSDGAPTGEVEALSAEIELLVAQVESLQETKPAIPSPAATPSPPKPFVVVYSNGISLRSGPGVDYGEIGVLTPGSRLEIVARNGDSSWWLVSTPNGLAWVSAEVVTVYDLNDSIPVVTIPGLLVQPRDNDLPPILLPNAGMPGGAAALVPDRPAAMPTPTAVAAESRIFAEDTVGFKQLREHLGAPPNSASFSPRGDKIAVAEGIKLHLVAGDGSEGRELAADDGVTKPVWGAVWSPDGRYIAYVVEYLDPGCKPCRSVSLVRLSDGLTFMLQTPDNMDSDAPRWTQDGRLLVNVYPGEPADGVAYIYDILGRGQVASGVYVLSSGLDGQRWLPWRPGRIWRAGVSERPDSYYND